VAAPSSIVALIEGIFLMSENEKKPKHLELVSEEALDADELEYRKYRRDLPGVKGAAAVGIVAIPTAKVPGKNEFFRTHPTFRPVVPILDMEVGMEKQFFAASDDMVKSLASIGIPVSEHTLYLTVTARGAVRIIPVRNADKDGEQNGYARTKEIGLLEGMNRWVRLYTDSEAKAYMVFPAPVDRFPDPVWPELVEAKIFRLAFRDRGHLIDSVEHPVFKKLAARDSKS
jgi:hypothetical protein